MLGILPGVMGALQATEALKLLLGLADDSIGRYFIYDTLTLRLRSIRVGRDPGCPGCSVPYTLARISDEASARSGPCAQPSELIEAHALATALQGSKPPTLVDVRTLQELALCNALPAALHIPLAELVQQAELFLAPNAAYVLYCQSGLQSAQACRILSERGYRHVKSLQGCLEKWHAYKQKNPSV